MRRLIRILLPNLSYKRIEKIVPPFFLNLVNNCGGTNNDITAFAGNLLRNDLKDDEFIKICYSLILKNGVRKTTQPSRNLKAIENVIRGNGNNFVAPIRILDIGASIGLDSLSTYNLLKNNYTIKEYILGDLYTEILFDKQRKLVFDQDGNLLQVMKGDYFVSIYFEFKFWYQRLANLHKFLRPYLLKKKYKFQNHNIKPIKLISPALLNNCLQVFRLQRLNVFEPIGDTYDIIICFHLLIKRYFSSDLISHAKQNLFNSLKIGGVLIVGEADNYEIIYK